MQRESVPHVFERERLLEKSRTCELVGFYGSCVMEWIAGFLIERRRKAAFLPPRLAVRFASVSAAHHLRCACRSADDRKVNRRRFGPRTHLLPHSSTFACCEWTRSASRQDAVEFYAKCSAVCESTTSFSRVTVANRRPHIFASQSCRNTFTVLKMRSNAPTVSGQRVVTVAGRCRSVSGPKTDADERPQRRR